MSIINDALKKTQHQIGQNRNTELLHQTGKETSPDAHDPKSEKPQNSPKTTVSEIKTAPSPKNSTGLTITLFFIICSLLLGGTYALMNKSPAPAMPTAITEEEINEPIIIVEEPETPQEEKIILPQLVGTLNEGDKWVALINNDVYEVGSFVKGMQITHINKNSVSILDNKGNTFILDIRK